MPTRTRIEPPTTFPGALDRIAVRRAVRHLRKVDPVMARLIARVGPCRFTPRVEGSHFDAVVRAIVYQQLSGKAAATIHGRLVERFGGAVSAAGLLAAKDADLRAAGISRQKTGYLRDLAARAKSGEVPFERLHELADAEIVEALVRVKGVGTWTAQVFLMFRLGRPDVLPVLDLGIQTAVQRAYGMRQRPKPKHLERVGEPWRPWRSVACWYLWRSIDGPAA